MATHLFVGPGRVLICAANVRVDQVHDVRRQVEEKKAEVEAQSERAEWKKRK